VRGEHRLPEPQRGRNDERDRRRTDDLGGDGNRNDDRERR
jgi:hypothetical protein